MAASGQAGAAGTGAVLQGGGSSRILDSRMMRQAQIAVAGQQQAGLIIIEDMGGVNGFASGTAAQQMSVAQFA